MLYQIGPVAFRHAPLNTDRVGRSVSGDYATKPVVGSMPVIESVGPANPTMRLSGSVFPKRLGGLSSLAILEQMVTDGSPHFVMRGDGRAFGWYKVASLTEDHNHLAGDGVGQHVRFTVDLIKTSRPSPFALFAIALGIFANA